MSDILLTEQLTASATPASGRVVIYPKTDGYLYFKDDSGLETRINTQSVATAAQWVSANPVVAAGAFGVESDTMKFKIGDGITAWNVLAYWRYSAEHLTKTTSGGTTVLTLAENRASSMAVTGVLVSNAAIVVANTMSLFVVENLTSGPYTVTFKTVAGSGVAVPQGAHVTLYADGVNVELPVTAGIGSGDVVGPAGAVNGKVAVFSGTTGKLLADSGVTLGSAATAATTDFDPTGSAATAETNAKAYADGLVVGLIDDRGNYNASVNTFPATGGSGTAGAILKGDLWLVSVGGTLGGVTASIGDNVRALVNTPGQTASNWAVIEGNLGYVPLSPSAIGSTVQAYDADLTTWAGVTPATGIVTFLTTPSSANLAAAVTDESGSGSLLFTAGVGSDLTLARIAGSTYSTLQHARNNLASSGIVSGGVISDAGGATINVTAGQCAIRPTTSHTATLYFADFPANNGIAIPANTIRYVGVEYNAGAPVVTIRALDNFNYMTEFPLGAVVNEGGVLHISTSCRHEISDSASHTAERFEHTFPFARDEKMGGLILGETGTRNITLTAGGVWAKLTEFTIPAFNSATGGVFTTYYQDGAGGFTKTTSVTQWPNTLYDNGTGTLATMTNNKYASLWFYLEPDDGDIVMLYGRAEYNSLSEAEVNGIPATSPDRVAHNCMLIGRIVFQKSAATAASIHNPFSTVFAASGASTHSNLANLDFSVAGHTGTLPIVNGGTGSATGLTDNLTTTTTVTAITDTDFVDTNLAAGGKRKTLWTAVKTYLKTYFDTLYPSGSGTSSGTNTGDNAANNSTHYVGTTAIALNRASAAQALTGITSIDGSSASCTGNAATVTTNANLSGHVTSVGNTASLGSFTVAQLNTAISDADVATGGGTATGTNTGDQTATTVSNTPAGSIAATTVQAAINELDTEKAALTGSASTVFNAANGATTNQVVNYGQVFGTARTIQVFTSGSGTYTKPAGCVSIRVEMVGAGGGGGSGGSAGHVTGSTGGDTTFGTSIASGGSGGAYASASGTGGAGGGVTAGTIIGNAIAGARGGVSANIAMSYMVSASGASTPLSGGGGGGANAAGGAGSANSGAGGGGGANDATSGNAGHGGGAGGYISGLIAAPSATYSYSIGAAGAGGTAGANGYAGGNGGSGVIVVEEFYV